MSRKHPTDRETLEKEVRMTFFVAGGPGGQHRNRAETGVRLFHPPSGVTVTATERRSQTQNRDLAFERLAARLKRLNRPAKKRIPTRKPRSAERRRLEEKRKQGRKKQDRQDPDL